MQHSPESDRLSAEDAVFYYLDTKEMPLHIACVAIFDGPVPVARCIRLIDSKLPLIPRYRQIVVPPPLNIGHPMWEWDPKFDIHNHIRGVRLKNGSEAELQTMTAQILSQAMDRDKPLWDITVVNGLKGRRSALIIRAHHCVVDGVAGVGLLRVLFDEASPAPAPTAIPTQCAADPAASLVETVLGACSELVERFVSAQSAALSIAENVA